eukprot:s1264_g4.t1
MESFGYASFASSNVVNGRKTRGCVTFVQNSLDTKLIRSFDNADGAALAVSVCSTMVINCYAPPRSDNAAAFTAHLNELLIAASWEKKQIWVGDWNVVPDDNWVHALASDHNMRVAETTATSSTRWKGKTVIDYYFHDFDNVCAHPLTHESAGLIKEAYYIGVQNCWDEVCHVIEPCTPSTASPSDDLDQLLADYMWEFTMLKLSWTLSKASYFALLEMPANETNWQNVVEITHNANNWKCDRLHTKLVQRDFPKFGDRRSMRHRQTLNRLNRTKALLQHLVSNRCDSRTRAMVRKLYPEVSPHLPSTLDVQADVEALRKTVKKIEEEEKQENLRIWRRKMKQLKLRSLWLTKSKISHYPNLCADGQTAGSKQDAVAMLFKHWEQLQKRVSWSPETFAEQAADLKNFFKDRLCTDECGPDFKDFAKSLATAKGAPGLDQWTADELHWIGKIPAIAKDVWHVMQSWHICTPSILQQLRTTWIPKQATADISIPPKKMRPITVMSIWWRAYSSAWMRSPTIKSIISKMPSCIHGIKGRGPEVAAAIVDASIKRARHACTLDFTSCFDTINVSLLHEVLSTTLQGDALRWCTSTLGHWLKCERWFVFNRHVHPTPHHSELGIPQGDPASPFCLALLMWRGADLVQQRCGNDLQQVIYMDDRSLISPDKQLLNTAVQTWQSYAQQIGLLENPDKTQWVDLDDENQRFMEVLGAIVGDVGQHEVLGGPVHQTRLMKALRIAKRIKFEPTCIRTKLQDLSLFARTPIIYGWINAVPFDSWCTRFERTCWRSIGRLTYAPQLLRSILAGTHFHVQVSVTLTQLRLKVARDHMMEQPFPCGLDLAVLDGLAELGWFKTGHTWQHEFFEFYFLESDVLNTKRWKEISHWVRESKRWKDYGELATSGRHKFQLGGEMPPFDLQRLKLVRRLARDSYFFPFFVGAVMSGKVKGMQKECKVPQLKCSKCGTVAPYWDHTWTCLMGTEAPDDILLRRFLWPRSTTDVPLIRRFIDFFRQLDSVESLL